MLKSGAKDGAELFNRNVVISDGVFLASEPGASEDELQTSGAFSEKWMSLVPKADDSKPWKQQNYRWYLTCYGYDSEGQFGNHVRTCKVVLDAGCGPGYKAAWFARLSPKATVVAMDLSDSIYQAAKTYREIPNLLFVKGDIATSPFSEGSFDLISCDQVLHHTDDPPRTVRGFARLLRRRGTLNTYAYARKALPRELLDDHFREYSKQLSQQELWELSDQLTSLGRTLFELQVSIDVPDIPALGITGGRMDLQRFIHWNFLKCFWNAEFGADASKMINFDWYAPSTAYRYTRDQFVTMRAAAGFKPEFLRSEEGYHTGRFGK